MISESKKKPQDCNPRVPINSISVGLTTLTQDQLSKIIWWAVAHLSYHV
jgi:hypothetical protein